MNYDAPRQLRGADGAVGGWHFTRFNRRTGTQAIGYCAVHDPHATAEEARTCYTRFLMTERVRFDDTVDNYNPCEADGCDTLTNRVAVVDGWHLYRLCDEHRDREHVAALFGEVSDSIHS